jgi:CBS domain-containing protein
MPKLPLAAKTRTAQAAMQLVARDIMSRSVVTATPTMKVAQLAALLAEKRISGAPVVDADGSLVAIVTEADILSRRLGQETVRSIMTTDVIAVGEYEPLQEIALLLSLKRINRVPVLRAGRLVGIVSRTDIVRAVAGITTAHAAGSRPT